MALDQIRFIHFSKSTSYTISSNRRCMKMTLSIEEIKRIISLQLGTRRIADQDRFLEDLDAESVDVMNIVVAVEEKFKIDIQESEVPNILTPIDLYNLVKSRI